MTGCMSDLNHFAYGLQWTWRIQFSVRLGTQIPDPHHTFHIYWSRQWWNTVIKSEWPPAPKFPIFRLDVLTTVASHWLTKTSVLLIHHILLSPSWILHTRPEALSLSPELSHNSFPYHTICTSFNSHIVWGLQRTKLPSGQNSYMDRSIICRCGAISCLYELHLGWISLGEQNKIH